MESVEGTRLDNLRIYGFSFDFPAAAKLEFNPKFNREAGDVAVKIPGAFVFVTWGLLERMPEKVRDVEAHAKYSEDRVRSSTRGKVTVLEHNTLHVNGHKGVYERLKVETLARKIVRVGFSEEEARSLHLHCEASKRFFVVYGALNEENFETQAETLTAIMGSLKCH